MKAVTRLIARRDIAEGTKSFSFKRPPEFDFKAGQTLDLMLLNPPETDAEGNIRTFSIASGPEDPEIVIASRMRDTAFKRVLGTMPIGSEVQIDGPLGSFLLPNSSTHTIVLLAGGIGITPFHSMMRHAAAVKLPHQIYLFYSNRRPEDSAFLDDLQILARENVNCHFIGTMTQMEKSALAWDGERGYVTAEMVKKYVKDISNCLFFSAGPPAMVAAMRKTLNEAGVDDDNIRTDEFSGY